MSNESKLKKMVVTILLGSLLITTLFMQGCSAGHEIGARIGYYRVDSHEERSSSNGTLPLRCIWADCSRNADSQQGS